MSSSDVSPGLLIPLTVHGPQGALDVAVPAQARVMDVAREYAAQSGSAAMPMLSDSRGNRLSPTAALGAAGVGVGDLLVASTSVHRGGAVDRGSSNAVERREPGRPDRMASWWVSLAVAAAVLGGWAAAGLAGTAAGRVACGVLAAAALVGILPGGRRSRVRALAAPAFAAAAAGAWLWQPGVEREPGLLALAGLAAALVAALGRAWTTTASEELAVWMAAGLLVFAAGGVGALIGASPAIVWSVLVAVAMLTARIAPAAVVDVPDGDLIDVDRLAVSAWSARPVPTDRHDRVGVRAADVADVAARGARLLTALSAAAALVLVVAAYRLVATTTLPVDRVGARLLVLLAGAGVLLAATQYRHPVARRFLCLGGLGAWAALLPVCAHVGRTHPVAVMLAVVVLAVAALICAVALGRGWRSVRWARAAELTEGLVGALGLAMVLVSTGAFRGVWETVSIHS